MAKPPKKPPPVQPTPALGKVNHHSANGPPLVVHTNLDIDARAMAHGYRMMHKDKAIFVDINWPTKDLWDANFIQMHGEEFCRRVVFYIAGMNQYEVGTFAADLSEKYRDRPEELVELVFNKSVTEAFAEDDYVKHGESFLFQVQRMCQNALSCNVTMTLEQRQQWMAIRVQPVPVQVVAPAVQHPGPMSAPLPQHPMGPDTIGT
jgi:hypothetical protein